MDILAVMDSVTAMQGEISITAPRAASIKKVYYLMPSQARALPSVPCFVNEWYFDREDRADGLRETYYVIHMQLLVYDADFNKAARIATAFMTATLDKFDETETLRGACSWSKLRGFAGTGQPTLFSAQWARRRYAALDLYLDVKLVEGKSFGR